MIEGRDVVLAGGGRTTVLRRGSIIVRATGPWARSVHALLRHLQDVGFEGAPRVVEEGFDEHGREVLTFIVTRSFTQRRGRTRLFTSSLPCCGVSTSRRSAFGRRWTPSGARGLVGRW